MAKEKTQRGGKKKTAARRKKSAVKRRAAPRAKPARGRKAVVRKKTAAARKTSARARTTPARKAPRKKPVRRPAARLRRGTVDSELNTLSASRGLGAESGGQSGDTEGLSRAESADSESVEELLEEGQAFEAGIVSGVENAPDADKGGVRTRQVPEDDVPQEYLDED